MKTRYAILLCLVLMPGCRGCNPCEPDTEPTPTAQPTTAPTAAITPTPASTAIPTATITATATTIPTPAPTAGITPNDGLHTVRYHCMSNAGFNYVHWQLPSGETHDLNLGTGTEWNITFQFTRAGVPIYPPNLRCAINADLTKVPIQDYNLQAEIYVDDQLIAVEVSTFDARASFAY